MRLQKRVDRRIKEQDLHFIHKENYGDNRATDQHRIFTKASYEGRLSSTAGSRYMCCGKTSYSFINWYFKDRSCDICNKEGHLKKFCFLTKIRIILKKVSLSCLITLITKINAIIIVQRIVKIIIKQINQTITQNLKI